MSLITRILPPDAKNAKLTFQEMDNNLYYLQSIGVSGLTFSSNTLSIINPTGGTKTTKIETLSRTLIPIGTTVTIEDNFQYFVFGDLVIQGVLNVKPNAEVVILNGDLINSGGTVNLSGTSQIVTLPEYNTFVTGGTFNQTTNSVLFTGNFGFTPFNVDLNPLKFTGGTITGSTNFTNGITSNTISATTYQNLPLDVTVTGGTFSAGTITFTNTTGGTFNVTGVTSTPSVNYTIYKALVSLSGGIFTVTHLENTIGDGSGVSPNDIQWSNPNNGIIRATKTGAFTSSNILISVENINGGGVPYICTGQKSTADFISINIFLHDGTLLSTPNFSNLPVEIRIY